MHPINPSGSITTRPRYQTTTTSSRLASTKSDLAAQAQAQAPPPPKTVGAPRYRTTTTNRPPAKPTSTLSTLSSSSSRLSTGASGRGTPLRLKDHNQNVLSLTATRSTIKSSSSILSMPPPSERPRQPQLSAAAARAASRTPLTPKVAAPKVPSVVTPMVRRTQNQQTSTYAATPSYHRDETTSTTPTSAYLGHNNITPRSGTRQSRVDSANSTPNGTPNPERTSDPWEESRLSIGSGVGAYPISALSYDGGRQTPSADSSTEPSDSKFFYASAAKSSQPVSSQRPTSVPQKQATFFYANGTSADNNNNSNNNRRLSPPMAMNPSMSPPILSPTTETAASKFFYANGTPDVSSKPSLPISSSASTISSSSRVMSKRPNTSQSTTAAMSLNPSISQRPISPIKSISTPTVNASHKTNSMPPSQPLRSMPLGSPPTLSALPSPTQKRHVTIETSQRGVKGHSRAGSVPAAETVTLTTASSSPEPTSPGLSPGLSPSPSQPAMTMASILQAAEELEEENGSKDGDSPADVQSPTKSTFSNDAVSELVANARRERKVQDLEITNASLEAINRTLERQLRKQTAELRRYRRLSRSGRISLASMASSRVASDALTEPPIDLSDVDEDEDDIEEEEEEEDDEDFDSLDESDASDTDGASADPLSPSAKMTIRRKRDEKRLQLDLTKHQELLVDSQKMNQSLKRCLDWTEVLIKEGHRALAYRVRVSDVELGGHVLAPPDEEDEVASHNGDETAQSIDIDAPSLQPPWTKGPQDRDSGIELPVEGG